MTADSMVALYAAWLEFRERECEEVAEGSRWWEWRERATSRGFSMGYSIALNQFREMFGEGDDSEGALRERCARMEAVVEAAREFVRPNVYTERERLRDQIAALDALPPATDMPTPGEG